MSDEQTKVMKRCKTCEVEKPLEEFAKRGGGQYRASCKKCENAKARKQAHGGDDPGERVRVKIDFENQMRTCTRCGRFLSFSFFHKLKGALGGITSQCRECKASHFRAVSNGGVDPGKREGCFFDAEAGLKSCSICGEVLPLSAFYKHSRCKGKLTPACKKCVAKAQREYKQNKKEMREVEATAQKLYKNLDEGRQECKTCHEVKPFLDFATNMWGVRGIHCKTCVRTKDRKRYNGGVDPGPRRSRLVDEKNQKAECANCGRIKALSEFPISKTGRAGKHARCKVCVNAAARKKYNGGTDPGPQYVCGVNYAAGTKECSQCGVWLPFDRFSPSKSGTAGLHARCYSCRDRARTENPQVSIRDRIRTYILAAVKRVTDDADKIARARLNYDLGCSYEILKFFLETQWYENPRDGRAMTWENYGGNQGESEGWTIDHIVPLAHFDLLDEAQFKKACHVSNLQPLWGKDNTAKGDKLMTQEEARRACNQPRVY